MLNPFPGAEDVMVTKRLAKTAAILTSMVAAQALAERVAQKIEKVPLPVFQPTTEPPPPPPPKSSPAPPFGFPVVDRSVAVNRAVLESGEIGFGDYPKPSLSAKEAGVVTVQFVVAESGSVSDCATIASSGFEALDYQTCRLIISRFKYRPATNIDGKVVPDLKVQRIRWDFPDESEYEPSNVVTTFVVKADGMVSECKVTGATSGDETWRCPKKAALPGGLGKAPYQVRVLESVIVTPVASSPSPKN
jgi:TonB family protein